MESAATVGGVALGLNQGVRGRKGVQQVDVDGAADAILAAGERPTVDRVRHHLGTGSPNTVAPMLEAWFKRLSARVAGMTQGGPGDALPPAAQNAFRLLWDTALAEARAIAAKELAQHQAKLDAFASQLAEDARVLEATRAAQEESLRLAQEQGAQHQARAGELAAALHATEAQLQDSQQRIAALQQQLDDERQRRDDVALSHQQERARDQERALANERRLLGEVDLAREDAKRLEKAVAAGTEAMKAQVAKSESLLAQNVQLTREIAEQREQHLRQDAVIAQAKADERTARELLAASEGRLADQAASLQAQRAAADDLRKQLAPRKRAGGVRRPGKSDAGGG